MREVNTTSALILYATSRARLLTIHQTYKLVGKKIRLNNDKKSFWLEHASFISLPEEKRPSFYSAVITNPWEFINLLPMGEKMKVMNY